MSKPEASFLQRSITAAFVVALLALANPARSALADNLVVNGDFSDGFTGWTKVVLAFNPVIEILPSSWCSAHQNSNNPAASFNVWSRKKGAIRQQIDLPPNRPYELTFREWGQLDATTVNVIIFDEQSIPHLIDTFVAERTILDYTFPGPVFQCTGNGQVTKSYDISQFAGQTIVLSFDATSTGFDGTFALIDDVTIEGNRGIQGTVRYRPESDESVAGVTIRLTGTTDEGDPVEKEVKTDQHGEYSFEVPKGEYTVEALGEAVYVDNGALKDENGGVLSAETSEGGDCEGTAEKNRCMLTLSSTSARADFSYTLCAAEERMPNGKPLTHCPIILVPGFLGSRIACQGTETWPGLPLPGWAQMQLKSDGATNLDTSDCNASAGPLQGEAGIVDSVAGSDIYKGALDFLKDEAPDRWRAAPYDWRKSPVFGASILEGVVDEVLETTKSKFVVLYGHSMGGLVIREFLNNQSNADKVARIVTAGTPYWGAPKSHFALLGGYTDTPGGSPLDYLTFSADLQLLARNLQGLFFLYPSAHLGSWLSVSPAFNRPLVLQGPAGEVAWMSALGASPGLLPNARDWHAANDGFPSTDIDYRVVVGSGSATTHETKVRLTIGVNGPETFGDIVIGNGDGTVPIRSATQGASDGGPPLGKNVPIHYACGVGHVDLPVNSLVLAGIRPFLLAGDDIIGLHTHCPYSGTAVLFYSLDLGGGNEINVDPDRFQSSPLLAAASAPIPLNEAVKQNLVQYLKIGETTIVISDDAKPVTLTLSGKPVPFQVRKFGPDGDTETESFQAVKGTVVIDTAGKTIQSAGTKVTGAKGLGSAPKTTAALRKKGSSTSVKLKAKGAAGVAGTFYQIGNGSVQRYTKSFKVKPGKKAVKIAFYSVNPFGVVEKTKRVTIRK